MGLFDWFDPKEPDKTLVEISNDAGDHIVAEVPTKGAKEVRKILKDAGYSQDRDESKSGKPDAARRVEKRDRNEYRYRMERVVNESEDLEDSHDRENDTSDYEDSHDREGDYSDWEEYDPLEEDEQPSIWQRLFG